MRTTGGELAALTEPVRIVLLDFDGPICCIFGARASARVATDLRRRLAGHGVDIAESVVEEGPLGVLRATLRMAPHLAGDVEAALHVAEGEAAAGAETTLGALDVVRACINTGRPLAIVSDTSTDAISAYLRRRELASFFAAVVGRDRTQVALLAPNPQRITRAVEALRADPAECLFVGTTVAGMQAGRKAGVTCVGYAPTPGMAARLASTGAHAVIDAMHDLA